MHRKIKSEVSQVVRLCSLSLFLIATLFAKETAVLTQLSGKIIITDSTKVAQQANMETRLHIGDKVEAAGSGEARILYYTGEEAVVRAGQIYYVKKNNAEDSFLRNLSTALSGFIWGTERSGAIAGATRSLDESDWLAKNVYPVTGKILQPRPTFRWQLQSTAPTKNLIIEILNDKTGANIHFPISETKTEMALPEKLAPLGNSDRYRWRIKDGNGKIFSASTSFSLLSPAEKTLLEKELRRIDDICAGNQDSMRYHLLCAAVYWQYELIKPAEEVLLKLLAQTPSAFQAHKMLAQLYRHSGDLQTAEKHIMQAEKLRISKK